MIEFMKRVYYKNDFDFLLSVRMADGQHVGWPQFDWSARFYTITPANSFTASCIKGECVNCYNDNGRIHIVAKDHRLSAGALRVIFVAHVPDISYADGYRKETVTMTLNDIVLTSDKGAVDIVLGAEAGADRAAYQLDKRIRRGIMPFKARRGIMYYNMGAVKVNWKHWAPYGLSRIVSDTERVFDLSHFASLVGNDAEVLLRTGSQPPHSREWYMEHLTYDKANYLLTLKGDRYDDWYGIGIVVANAERSCSRHGEVCDRTERRYVVYFDRDMKLREDDAGFVGASEYMHDLPSEVAAAFVDGLRPDKTGAVSRRFVLRTNVKIWRYKLHNIGKVAPYKKFYRFTLWKPKWVPGTNNAHLYDSRITRLFRVQLKSRKGYTSRMVRVSRSFSMFFGKPSPSQTVAID